MAIIGTLAVSITARTKKFRKGIKSARRTLKKFAAFIPGLNANLGRFAAIAGAAVVAGLTLLTKRSLDVIDATAKMSDRMNISTENLVSYRLAAELAGVSNAELDKSIEQFVRRLGEAKQGTGTAKVALDQMGLSADKLSKMDTADAMAIIADKIALTENAADRAALSYELFGRTGVKLTNLLLQGSKGLEAAKKEAELLGITFNRLDASKVEEANDAMARLKVTASGLGNAIAIQLSIPLKIAADRATKFVSSLDFKKAVKTGFEFVLKTLGKMLDIFSGLRGGWNLFQGSVQGGLGIMILGTAKFIEQLESLLFILGRPFSSKVSDAAKSFADGFLKEGASNIAEAKANLKKFEDGFALNKVKKFLASVEEGLGKVNKEAKKTKKTVDKIGDGKPVLGTVEGPPRTGAGQDGRGGSVREFSAARFFVGALQSQGKKKQRVEDKGVKDEIVKLRKDLRNSNKGARTT